MKRKLEIEIECGELTCAFEPGKFCKFVGAKSFGTKFLCRLFPEDNSYTMLYDEGGWLMRCEQCLKKERKKGESV
jgi:hypothetical protein